MKVFRKIEAWFYILVYLLEHDTENTQFFVNISNMVMTNPKKFFENVKKIKLSGKIFPLKNKLLPDPMKLIMQGKRKSNMGIPCVCGRFILFKFFLWCQKLDSPPPENSKICQIYTRKKFQSFGLKMREIVQKSTGMQ
jgi:hypothetical protein